MLSGGVRQIPCRFIRCWSAFDCHSEGAILLLLDRTTGCADDLTLFKDLHGAREAAEWVAAYWERCDDPTCLSIHMYRQHPVDAAGQAAAQHDGHTSPRCLLYTRAGDSLLPWLLCRAARVCMQTPMSHHRAAQVHEHDQAWVGSQVRL